MCEGAFEFWISPRRERSCDVFQRRKAAIKNVASLKRGNQRGQDSAVGPVQPGPGMVVAQHGDLVPQHKQLDVLVRR